jgi:hypothetical protein
LISFAFAEPYSNRFDGREHVNMGKSSQGDPRATFVGEGRCVGSNVTPKSLTEKELSEISQP